MAPSTTTSPTAGKRKRSRNEVAKSDTVLNELKETTTLLSAPAQKVSHSKKKDKVLVTFTNDDDNDKLKTPVKEKKKQSKEERKAEKAAAKEARKKEKKERKRAEMDAVDTAPNGDSNAGTNGSSTTNRNGTTNIDASTESSIPVTPIKHSLSKLTFDSPALPTPMNVDNNPATPTPSKKPKKSVKFDPEAAAEDGTSRQEIHKAILGRYASAAIVTAEDFASSLDADKPPPSKKLKREKKKKGKNDAASNEGTSREAAILYLLSYHTDRPNWKFNKAKQNWILRHLFNVDMIPFTKENGAALKAYIAGLQSKDARSRLVSQAKDIVKEIERFNEEKAAKDAEMAKVAEDDDKDEEEEEFPEEEDEEAIVRGKRFARAKLVLASMGDEEAEKEAEGLSFTKLQASAKEEDSSESSDESSDDDDSE